MSPIAPDRNSSITVRISASVFMTKGPERATGSPIGGPAEQQHFGPVATRWDRDGDGAVAILEPHQLVA